MSPDVPVPAAQRTLGLLELLLAHPGGMTPQDMQARLGISRSTLFALLQTLRSLGYVEQASPRGRYKPGPRLLAWRRSTPAGPQDLITAFYQESAETHLQDTLLLTVLSRAELLVLAQQEGRTRVRAVFSPGERLPAQGSAAGAVLAPDPDPAVRQQGWAARQRDHVVELALPLCPDGHTPTAALVLVAPLSQKSLPDLQPHLTDLQYLAAHISYRLGAVEYRPFHRPPLPGVEALTPMEPEEIDAFLQGPWPARLACLREDGTPHVVPVWQEWYGQAFFVLAWQDSQWAAYLQANPRVSLTVDEPWPPLKRVTAWGEAVLLPPGDLPGGVASLLERLSRRYLGYPLSPAHAVEWQVFRIQPQRIRGWRGLQA